MHNITVDGRVMLVTEEWGEANHLVYQLQLILCLQGGATERVKPLVQVSSYQGG